MRYFLFFIIMFTFDAHADTTTGLVGWWRMDEAAGTSAEDRSGKGNTGTLVGTPTWGAGKRGNAVSFNGANYITVAQSPISNFSNPSSICLWGLVTDNTGSSGGSNQTFLNFAVDANNEVRIVNNSVAGTGGAQPGGFAVGYKYAGNQVAVATNSSGLIPNNTWTFLCYTYDGAATVTLYVNAATYSTTAASVTQTTSNIIGARATNASFLTGSVDDIRVYNRTLTAQDVYMLYLSDNKIRNAVMRNVQFK